MHERSDPTVHAVARDESDTMLEAAHRIIAASREAFRARPQQEERAGARRDALRHAAATVRPSMR